MTQKAHGAFKDLIRVSTITLIPHQLTIALVQFCKCITELEQFLAASHCPFNASAASFDIPGQASALDSIIALINAVVCASRMCMYSHLAHCAQG